MPQEKVYTVLEAHRYFAVEANQRVWTLLAKKNRTSEESDEMLHAAHTSYYHWLVAGNVTNQQRAEWLLYRVYSELELFKRAAYHARRCHDLTQRHPEFMQDFDVAYSHECMARTFAMNGDLENAKAKYDKAKDAANRISNEEDRKIFMGDFTSGKWFGLEK